MPAVPGKGLARRPCLQDQLQGLAVALALLDRHDPVGDRGVGRQTGRKAGDEPAARKAVDHRVFLGDAGGRAGRGQGRADLHDRDLVAFGHFGERRPHQAGIGHKAVDILVVLVRAQAVHAGLGGVDHLVEGPVIVAADLLGVGNVEPDRIEIGRFVAPVEIRRQIAVRHQMKHANFHRLASSTLMPTV
jgi:hypothetical protein